MLDIFKIYIDRLKEGKEEILKESAPPDFLEVSEENLSFPSSVEIEGVIYLAEDHVVAHLDVKTMYKTHCKICNEPLILPLSLTGIYITEEIQEVRHGVFSLKEPLRDAILLEIPLFSECEGDCPSRETLKTYLKRESS